MSTRLNVPIEGPADVQAGDVLVFPDVGNAVTVKVHAGVVSYAEDVTEYTIDRVERDGAVVRLVLDDGREMTYPETYRFPLPVCAWRAAE